MLCNFAMKFCYAILFSLYKNSPYKNHLQKLYCVKTCFYFEFFKKNHLQRKFWTSQKNKRP